MIGSFRFISATLKNCSDRAVISSEVHKIMLETKDTACNVPLFLEDGNFFLKEVTAAILC